MKRNTIILTIVLILVVILFALGAYAFFSAEVRGNPINNNVTVKAGSLIIEYIEGSGLSATNIEPNWTGTKTFKVHNTGSSSASYDIVFNDLWNTFMNNELWYSATCSSDIGTCTGVSNTNVPEYNAYIKQSISILPNEIHSYTVNFSFPDTSLNQNYNMGATLGGKIEVHETGEYTINPLAISVDIDSNMIPVMYVGSKLVKADVTNSDPMYKWYNYGNGNWANMVLVKTTSDTPASKTRAQYIASPIGTEIIEEDILAYYVWIPRYRGWLQNPFLNVL